LKYQTFLLFMLGDAIIIALKYNEYVLTWLWLYIIYKSVDDYYRKIWIDRPGDIHFFSTHNFWTTCHGTMIKAYSEWKVSTLSECGFIFVLLCMIQKLCVEKKWIPPGLSIEILRYISILLISIFISTYLVNIRTYLF